MELDAINDAAWWRYDFEEPALLHLNGGAASVSQVGHDARTRFRGSSLQSEGPPNKKRLTGDHRRPLHSQV